MQTLWRRASTVERVGYVVGLLLITSGLIHVAILVVTGGSWQGPLSLRKPATFGLSFGLTLLTIVGVSPLVKLGARTRSMLLAAFTAASVLETALITLQAWRGVPSHFNVETPFDAWVTRGLAGGGVALVVMVLVLTIAAFRKNSGVPASLRIAVQAGFVALSGAMAVGGAMIGRGMTMVYSGHAQDAYATGGVLKPMHAVTMHAILVLPVLAWLLSLTDWSEAQRLRVVRLALGTYGLVVATVAAANLSGLI